MHPSLNGPTPRALGNISGGLIPESRLYTRIIDVLHELARLVRFENMKEIFIITLLVLSKPVFNLLFTSSVNQELQD